MEGIRESIDFATNADLWSRATLTPSDGSGIGGEFSNRSEKQNEDSDDKSKDPQANKCNGPDNGSAPSLYEREDVLLGFVNTKAADNFPVFSHGGADEHH